MNRLIDARPWVIGAAALMTIGAAPFAHANDSMVANVPFAFVVGRSQLPAGDYVVSAAPEDSGVVLIESKDGKHATFSLTIPSSSREAPGQPGLTFEKIGGQYFLAGVALADNPRDLIVTPSQIERGLVAAGK